MGDYVDPSEIVGPAPSSPYVDPSEIVGPAVRPPMSLSDRLSGLAGQLGRFATFGYGDEAAATLRSKLYGTDYERELAGIHDRMDRFQEEYPARSAILNIAGGLPIAVAAGSMAAPQSLAGNVGLGIAQGGAFGALQGSGEAPIGKRTDGAIYGGLGGAVVGGAVPAVGHMLLKALTSPTAYNIAKRLGAYSDEMANEAGALTIGGEKVGESIPKEYAILANRLRTQPEADLVRGRELIAKAAEEGSPMFLPESLPNGAPSLDRLVRVLGQREGTMNQVGQAIGARKAGALDRVTGILDEMSPERSPVLAGQRLVEGAAAKADVLQQARDAAAEVMYGAARKALPTADDELGLASSMFGGSEPVPVLKSPAVREAMDNVRVKSAIAKVRKDFPELDSLPDHSFDVLQKAKEVMDAQIDDILSSPRKPNSMAGMIGAAKNRLIKAMDSEFEGLGSKAYENARSAYAEQSGKMEEFASGPARVLLNLDKNNAEKAGARIFGLDPKRIEQLKQALGGDNAQAIVDASRAALQEGIEQTSSNRNLVADIVDRPAMQKKIQTIIGDNAKFERLMEALGRENTYAQAANRYHPGSSTFGNFEEAANFEKQVSGLQKLLRDPKGTTVDAILKRIGKLTTSDEVAQRLVEVLMNTERGVDFYDQMLPYISGANRVWEKGAPVVRGAAVSGAQIGSVAPKK